MANFKVRVGMWANKEHIKSYGLLVDIFYDKETGLYSGASRVEWFPKSLCVLEEVKVENELTEYYLTSPEWLLKKNNVKYEL